MVKKSSEDQNTKNMDEEAISCIKWIGQIDRFNGVEGNIIATLLQLITLLQQAGKVNAETLDSKIESKNNLEIKDNTPADVLEFRRWFVDEIRKNYDVTQEKLEKIVKIGENLVNSKEFDFEKTAYGEMWVLKLWWKTMKFLKIAHPQDFNNQLTHKIKDGSLKHYDFKKEWWCRCNNIQDLVLNKAMPWWREEDVWIIELIEKVGKTIRLWQFSIIDVKDTIHQKLKEYCNQIWVNFSNENDYMLLFMYLIWPEWWFWWRWLKDLKNSLRSYYGCNPRDRWISSNDTGDFGALLLLGSIE